MQSIEMPPGTANILVVDDEPKNRKLLETLLGSEGYHTLLACSGEEALASVTRIPPDLILLDVMMPGLDGFSVARILKANPVTTGIPIIMVTAKSGRDARLQGLGCGVEEFLTKPIDRAELMLRVRNLLRLKSLSDFHQKYSSEMQVELRASEVFAQATFDSVSAHVCVLDETGKIVAVNLAWREFCRQNHPQPGQCPALLGSNYLGTCEAAFEPDAQGAKAMATGIRQVMDGAVTEFTLEYPCHSPTEQRWFLARVTRFRDASHNIVIAHENITERKLAEIGIKHLNRVYAVLSQINALIVRVRDRDELFREACRIALEAGGFRMAMIGIVDRATNKVVPVASAGKDEELLTAIRKLLSSDEKASTTMVAKAIRDKTAIVSNDSEGDPRSLLRENYTRAGVRSLAVVPLIVSGEAVGILALYARERDFFHEEEMKLLTELADGVAFASDYIRKQERLDHLASYDPLTGLANRRLFLERLVQRTRGAAANDHRLALFVIDLERFKNINDTLGRPAGDALLQQVAGWLTQYVDDVHRVARVGADQFAVVMPEIRHTGDAVRQLEAMTAALLLLPVHLRGDEYRIAAKFGVAMFPDDGADVDILFQNAEAALKKAKAGGHRHLLYTPKMTETVAHRLNLENQLRQALDNQEFVLHYQPKISLATGRVTSVEALIRWNDPRTGLVPPGLFIPILEETGLIYEVGRWALHQSLEDYLRWCAAGLRAVRIAVNVSPLQFRHPGFIAALGQLVATNAHAAQGLELELTEGIIMDDMQQAIASLHAIHALGISIAIDDFGTGFSSLGYLSKLPIDTLKIDRMFVTDMVASPQGLSLVSTIIGLAHSLELKVVAEGVETEEQAQLLRLLNCDEMQGYLFSRPVPVDELERKYLVPPPGDALASFSGGRVDIGHIAKLRRLRAIVAEQGVRAGLMYLNGLTKHRFTALYRFDGDTLHNVVFYDRENPSSTSTESIPVLASYCVFVRDSNAPFHTDCAADDDRLGDHPKRQVIQSYCGVPLRDGDGNMFGTICHFDFAPARISQENLELMEDIAPALKEKIKDPGAKGKEDAQDPA